MMDVISSTAVGGIASADVDFALGHPGPAKTDLKASY